MCWKMGSIPQNVDLDKLEGSIQILSSYPRLHHLKPINKSWTHGEEEKKQTIRYAITLQNWGAKEEARKIEVQLHQTNRCKFFDIWINICFPFMCLFYEYIIDYLIIYRIIWSREGFRVIFVNAGLNRRTERIFVERKTKSRIKCHLAKEKRSVLLPAVRS